MNDLEQIKKEVEELKHYVYKNEFSSIVASTKKYDFSQIKSGTPVFKFATDNTDPTGGGGAATGRIAIDIAGVTKYIAYY